jgi:hypothetical protein
MLLLLIPLPALAVKLLSTISFFLSNFEGIVWAPVGASPGGAKACLDVLILFKALLTSYGISRPSQLFINPPHLKAFFEEL